MLRARHTTQDGPERAILHPGPLAATAIMLIAVFAAIGAMPVAAENPPVRELDPENAREEAAQLYFPLLQENRWIYEVVDNRPNEVVRLAEVRITDVVEMGDDLVYTFDNYCFGLVQDPMRFLNGPDGTVEVAAGVQGTWYPWGSDASIAIPEFGADCVHGSQGFMLDPMPVSVPAGTFDDAITIIYDELPCADQGMASETFVPHIGLIRRQILTLAGLETWSLRFAVVNGQAVGQQPLRPISPRRANRSGASGSPGQHGVEASTWGAIKTTFDH